MFVIYTKRETFIFAADLQSLVLMESQLQSAQIFLKQMTTMLSANMYRLEQQEPVV